MFKVGNRDKKSVWKVVKNKNSTIKHEKGKKYRDSETFPDM